MNNLSLNIITFPLWWYSTGTIILFKWIKKSINYGLHQTGLLLFAKHITEPMFGDYSRSGIVVGIFLRSVLLIFKLLVFGIRILLLTTVLILYWLILPMVISVVIYQIYPK